jgi:hypothetical protein
MPAALDRQQVAERSPQGNADVDETWRPILGIAGFEVSSRGRVRNSVSLALRKLSLDEQGYEILRFSSVRRTRRVHILVAEAFLGPRPAGRVINHIDGNKRHNRPGNLEYVTQRENIAHAQRTGLMPRVPVIPRECRRRGEQHSQARFSDAGVIAARDAYRGGATIRSIAAALGVSEAAARDVIRGKRWAHLPGAVPFQS